MENWVPQAHPDISGLHWVRIPGKGVEELREKAMALLDPREVERYARYTHKQSGLTFLLARYFLKTTLAGLLKAEPEDIHFSYAEGGKPYLADCPDLCFNISHAGDTIALYYSCEGEVGVDVEEYREMDYLSLAKHFFSPAESVWLEKAVDDWERRERFFNIWTEKEAYLKGTGQGLPGGLKGYTVPCVSGKRILDGFRITDFRPAADILGAAAIRVDYSSEGKSG